MTLSSGLGSHFGLAQESQWGTVVTPDHFYEFDSETFARQQTFQDAMGLKAGRFTRPAARMVATTRQAGGQVNLDVPTKQFGQILNLLHSATATPAPQGGTATGAYLQSHPVGTTEPSRSATVQFNKPDVGANSRAFTYPGSVITAIEFSCDTGGLLKCQVTMDSQDEQTSVSSPVGTALAATSYASGSQAFNHTQASVTIDGSPSSAIIRSFTLTVTIPRNEERFGLGSGALKARQIINGILAVAGTLNMEFTDMAEYTRFVTDDRVPVVVTFTGDAISGAYHDYIKFTIPSMQYRGDSPNIAGPDILMMTTNVAAGDDGTNPVLTVDYQSTDLAI